MADTPEVTVTGDPWRSSFQDYSYLQGIRDVMAGAFASQMNAPASAGADTQEAGMPAVPLPEVVVSPTLDPPPRLTPMSPLPPANNPSLYPAAGIGAALTAAAAGVLGLLFPQPTGPREFDEAPTPQPDPEPLPLPEITVVSTPLPYPLYPLDPLIEMPYGQPFSSPLPDRIPGPGPGFSPDPLRTPGVPDPFTPAVPTPAPRPGSRPLPESPTAPDVFAPPATDPFADPFRDPLSEPVPDAPPRPAPDRPGRQNPGPDPLLIPGTPLDFPLNPSDRPDVITLPTNPNPFFDTLLEPFLQPVPEPNADLDPEEDRCDCEKKKKKKKKKKPQPRTVCYTGTYRQRAKGISYSPKNQVPCDSPARSTRKGKTPTWNDTLRDVFQLPT